MRDARPGRLQDLHDHAPCGYCSLYASGLFCHPNAATQDWLGCSACEVIGKLGPRDFSTRESAVRAGESLSSLPQAGSVGPVEFDLVSRQGKLRRVVVTATATATATAIRDGEDRFVRGRFVMYDVTELDLARKALQVLNRQQAAMLGNELVGIQKLRDRRMIWSACASERLFGYQAGTLICMPARLTLSRVGGDEFVLILPHLRDRQGYALVIAHIEQAVVTSVPLVTGLIVQVVVSIGEARFPDDGATGTNYSAPPTGLCTRPSPSGVSAVYRPGAEHWAQGAADHRYASVDQRAVLVVEGMRAVELADGGLVRYQLAGFGPSMDQEAWRFQREAGSRIGRQVQADLVGGGRGGHCQRAAPKGLDGPVQMAADDPLHLRLSAQQRSQLGPAVTQADHIHMADVGGKGRVVHGQHGGCMRVGAQQCVEPLQALGAQLAVRGTWGHRVQCHQAQAAEVDRILHEVISCLGGLHIGMLGEGLAQAGAVVVVARH